MISKVPTWQSETSKSHKRGKLVMIEGAMITGGIALSYWLDFGFSFLEPSTIAWRFPIGFQIVFAIVILCFILELPESPRWLILKNKDDEAMSVLSALRDLPIEDPYIHSEYTAIKDTVIEMQAYSWKDLFSMGPDRHFHRVVLGYVNQVFQQISGINRKFQAVISVIYTIARLGHVLLSIDNLDFIWDMTADLCSCSYNLLRCYNL